MNYVYILECEDGSYYTGWTNDLNRRFEMHCKGKGAKYTRTHHPLRIAYFEEFEDKIEAMKREYAIKQLKRSEKLMLINKCSKVDEA